jgi:hypothetical protein
MAPNMIGAGLIDAVDDWLLKQKPQLGAGQSPPPGPGPQAPSRIGASTQPQAPPIGATPPFLAGPAYSTPAKIGAVGLPIAPDTTAMPPTDKPPAKIGGGMFTAPDTSAAPPAAGQAARIGATPQPAGTMADTYDPSQSPMPAGQPDYAARYAAVKDPAQLSPDAGKPSTLRRIGGIATGALIGALNPEAGAKIGSSIVSGPRRALESEYNQAEAQANRQRAEIKNEAGLADTGSQIEQRQAQAAKDRFLIGNPKEQKPENLDREAYDYYISKGMTPADARKQVLADAADQKPQKFTNPFEAFAYGTAEQKKAAQDFIAFEKQQDARYERPGEVEQRYALYLKDPDAFKAMYGDRAAAQGSRDEAQAARMLKFFDGQRKQIESDFTLDDQTKQQKLAEVQELEKPYLDAAKVGGPGGNKNAGANDSGPRPGEVEVINPDGQHGYIPRAKLNKALGRGYKQANQ